MDVTLANVFYTLGIIVAILNVAFLIAVSVVAWYAYQAYQRAKLKMQSVPALFMAKKIISNPLRAGTGMMALQVLGSLVKMFRGRRARAL